jgi:pimeloyl-ACP methyl ester carboxylesterase
VKILKRLGQGLLLLILLLWAGLAIYAYWPTGIEEVPARELAGAADRFVEVDGLELRYREFGSRRENLPSVLLIHGFGNSLQSFRELAPRLAPAYHVISVDMPGFGLSAKPADWDYGNASQARMMGELIKALELDSVVVGGHSLGGAIAMRVAIEAPEVSGLVLMNPGIINTGVPVIAEYYFFPLQRLSAKQFGNRSFRESFLKQSYVRPEIITPAVVDDLMMTVKSEGYMSGMTSMMGQYSAASEGPLMPDVRVPVMITWGEQDRNKDEAELQALIAGLSNAPVVEVLRVPDAGHYVHEEGAAAVADALIAARSLWLTPDD